MQSPEGLEDSPFITVNPKGGISILVDNGPLGCYLWCCASHWRGFFTLLKLSLAILWRRQFSGNFGRFVPFCAVLCRFCRVWPFLAVLATFESNQLLEAAVQWKQEAHSHLHFEPVEYLQFKINYVRIKALTRDVGPNRPIQIRQFLGF
jgi:hypothetical protein